MASMQVPLPVLTPRQVGDIIRDYQQSQAGSVAHFCIDPHEVYDYCFPIDAGSMSVDISRISDDQLALHEVLLVSPNQPLLLPEYADELRRLSLFVRHTIETAYDKAELVDSFERHAGLTNLANEKSSDEVLAVAERRMNSVIAVALGIYSVGAERFDHVMQRRITTIDVHADSAIRDANRDYVPSDLPAVVLPSLMAQLGKTADRHRKAALARTAEADLRAIDRVLFLNRTLEDYFVSGRLAQRHFIFYLSSAPRTRWIFEHPAVAEALPLVAGTRYSVWRTRKQVFVSLVNRCTNEDGSVAFGESIQQLEQVLTFVTELETIGQVQNCADCVLDSGVGTDCAKRERCHGLFRVARRVRERRRGMDNLELARRIGNYDTLQKLAGRSEIHRRIVYREFLSRVDDAHVQRLALQRIKDVYRVVRNQSLFASKFAAGFEKPAHYVFLRTGRDAVSAAIQYLPVLPVVRDPSYVDLMHAIVEFLRQPAHTPYSRLSSVESVSDAFLERDADVPDFHRDHELVRCMLYMALPVADGDVAAFEHAVEMRERFGDDDREFVYVAAWAGRRSKRYERTDAEIREGLQRYPEDARLWHGLALNVYAWWADDQASQVCPYSLTDAIDATRRAVELFGEPVDGLVRSVVAANFNNLAYLHVLQMEDASYSVVASRAALDKLKELLPRRHWTPVYPEYFHTEAVLEFREASDGIAASADRAYVVFKLRQSLEQIERALLLVPGEEDYIRLRERIYESLNSIRADDVTVG